MIPLMSPVKSRMEAMISASVALSILGFLKADVSGARDLTEPCKQKTPDGVQARLGRPLSRQHREPVSITDLEQVKPSKTTGQLRGDPLQNIM